MAQAISKMETTQTAVEFLKDRLESILELYNSEWDKVYQAIEQAKQMEKEQIEKAKSDGYHEATSEAIKEIHKNYQPIK